MMKTETLIGFVIILLLISCKAIQPLQPSFRSYKNKAFKMSADSVDVGNKTIKYMLIQEKDGKYIDTLPPNAKPYYWLLPIKKDEVIFDEDRIEKIVKNILKHKAERLHQHKESLGLNFYFEKDGSIGMLTMRTNNPTIINIKEIYEIQARLKQEIQATFKGDAWKDYGVIKRGMRDIKF